MREQAFRRLQELQTEFEAGQRMLAELGVKQDDLRQTMLRISGAIQVLEELLEAADSTAPAESQGEATPALKTVELEEE
jgi:hypothetical protein